MTKFEPLKDPRSAWPQAAVEVFVPRIIGHVISSPAVSFAVGNTFRHWQLGNKVGCAASAVTAAVAIGYSAYEAIKKEQHGIPLYALGMSHVVMTGSLLMTGVEQHGVRELLAFGDAGKAILCATVSHLFWGIGAFCAGYHEARNSQPRYIIDDVQVHYGLGDVASLVLNSPFAAIGPIFFPYGKPLCQCVSHRFCQSAAPE